MKTVAGVSTGKKYQLDFSPDTVTFIMVKDPDAEPRSVPYLARKIGEDLYLVHWLVRSQEEGNIHVALVLDFKAGKIFVSSLMPGGLEFFDEAPFEEVKMPD